MIKNTLKFIGVYIFLAIGSQSFLLPLPGDDSIDEYIADQGASAGRDNITPGNGVAQENLQDMDQMIADGTFAGNRYHRMDVLYDAVKVGERREIAMIVLSLGFLPLK